MLDLLLPVLAAPFVGSLLGVLAMRLPVAMPVVMDRSRCNHCHRTLGPLDLVPLLSYALLRGRCRFCRGAIGAEHPAIELAALALALWVVALTDGPARVWASCVLGWTLLTLSWIDWTSYRLPDGLTLPLLLCGLAFAWLEFRPELFVHALGAAVGYIGFRALAWLYRVLRGHEGLGQGDAKLLAASGAWVGVDYLPDVVWMGASIGIAMALIQAWRAGRLDATARIPFGPCLALATWLVWLYRF
jgi:leader peptidase (prepilin peptidase) / N-methyltransferase